MTDWEFERKVLVARAALFMDSQCPGWADKVDANTLDMGDGMFCISGQVYGERTWEATSHAFAKAANIPTQDAENTFANNDRDWKIQVLARKTKPDLKVIAEMIEIGYTEGDGWKLELL